MIQIVDQMIEILKFPFWTEIIHNSRKDNLDFDTQRENLWNRTVCYSSDYRTWVRRYITSFVF